MSTPNLKIHVYADGANKDDMLKRLKDGTVKGFTTNPSLMVKGKVQDYEKWAHEVLKEITTLPISFEVFSDDFAEMKRQGLKIAGWGKNVNVKIPVTNTKGQSSLPLIKDLLSQGVKLNVTALFTREQCQALREIVTPKDDVIVSIFAGRIADTGVDPMPLMKEVVQMFKGMPGCKVLWASSREVLNVYQAEQCGCQIITVTDEIIKKLPMHGKSGEELSLDTVKMFYEDASKAGFKL